MVLTTEQKKAKLEKIPWVTRLKYKPACDAKQGKCKRSAEWKFKSLEKSLAKDGNYCMAHLLFEMYSDMREQERLTQWSLEQNKKEHASD